MEVVRFVLPCAPDGAGAGERHVNGDAVMERVRATSRAGGFGRGRFSATIVIATAMLTLSAAGAAHAQLPADPIGDQLALGQAGGQTPPTAPVQKNAEPSLAAVPPAQCPSGPHTQPGIDGRVPAGSATDGLWCNASLVAHQGNSGGFKTLRYVDPSGHVCAYYDTALLFPINAFKLDTSSVGVAVVDMTDPAHPVQTATLATPPMNSPHESLNLNPKRGLLAAVLGNPSTYPGDVDIYDVHADCRHPVLDFEGVIARLGHESGFSPDGKTFYATGTAYQSITAIDVTDPKHPHDLWQGNVTSHGLSLSDDGTRAYVADSSSHELAILDTSQIQMRLANPQVSEVARLTWKSVSIPQNAIPFTESGHPYLLEFDEYSAGLSTTGEVGAARVIDISDERHPVVVSNLRLQIDQQPDRANAANDPGMQSPVQGYAAHYCNIPTRVDPKIVACSFIASGLRVFDISDLLHPKEAAYFVAPTKPAGENSFNASDFAMSQPAFDTDRHDVWFTDGASGFYNVHIADNAWPAARATPPRACRDKRRFTFSLHHGPGSRVVDARVFIDGKLVKHLRGSNLKRITIARPPRGRFTVKIVTTSNHGSTLTSTRKYTGCVKGRPHTRSRHHGRKHP
jgi:hypothetical protein